jgi:hypothetical protein
MDSLSLIMFAFVTILGVLTQILGFGELREIFRGKDKTVAAPAMGTIYFFIGTILWFVLAMWWPAMATDEALGTLGFFWYGFGLMNFAFIWACIGFLAIRANRKEEHSSLEIREEQRYEGYR